MATLPETPPIFEAETPALRARLVALVAETHTNLTTGARENAALGAAALDAVCAEPTLTEVFRASPLAAQGPGFRQQILQRSYEYLLRHPLEDTPRLVAHLERALAVLAAAEAETETDTVRRWNLLAQRVVGLVQVLRRHGAADASEAVRAVLADADAVRAALGPRQEAAREAAQAAAMAGLDAALRNDPGGSTPC